MLLAAQVSTSPQEPATDGERHRHAVSRRLGGGLGAVLLVQARLVTSPDPARTTDKAAVPDLSYGASPATSDLAVTVTAAPSALVKVP
ncbi:hypothetical protein GCM10022248_05500 [Nonomuraea soli]